MCMVYLHCSSIIRIYCTGRHDPSFRRKRKNKTPTVAPSELYTTVPPPPEGRRDRAHLLTRSGLTEISSERRSRLRPATVGTMHARADRGSAAHDPAQPARFFANIAHLFRNHSGHATSLPPVDPHRAGARNYSPPCKQGGRALPATPAAAIVGKAPEPVRAGSAGTVSSRPGPSASPARTATE